MTWNLLTLRRLSVILQKMSKNVEKGGFFTMQPNQAQPVPYKEIWCVVYTDAEHECFEMRSFSEETNQPVTLGDSRLRTETAGLVSCVLMANG